MIKIEKRYIIAGIILMLCLFIFMFYLMFSTPILIARSAYRGYEAGYEEVFLSPPLFCSKEMKTTDGVEIDSDLKTDTEKYTYNIQTKKVVTKDRDYLYEGKYEMALCLNKDKQQILLSVYDTQAPIFLEYNTHLTIEQGMQTKELAPYFPIMDYDDKKEIILFMEDIDLNKVQKTKATVLAKDSHGNHKELKVELNIVSHEWAKKNPKKMSRRYKDDNPSKVTVLGMEEYSKTVSDLDKSREEYLKKEADLAKSMGEDKPDFEKYDKTRNEIEENLKGGATIEEAKEEAEKTVKEEEKKDKENTEDKEEKDDEEDIKDKEDKPTNNSKPSKPDKPSKPTNNPTVDKSVLRLKSTNLTQWTGSNNDGGIDGYYIGNRKIRSLEDNILEAKDKNGNQARVTITQQNGYVEFSIPNTNRKEKVAVTTRQLQALTSNINTGISIYCGKDAETVTFELMTREYIEKNNLSITIGDSFGKQHTVPVQEERDSNGKYRLHTATIEKELDVGKTVRSVSNINYKVNTGMYNVDGTEFIQQTRVMYTYWIVRGQE